MKNNTDSINSMQIMFNNGEIEKSEYIKLMHEKRHSVLFEYSKYIKNTNIKKIDIEDDCVIMTSRDRGIKIACASSDFRIAPIEMLNFFDYEKFESKMMENLIGEKDNFFDIGANIGWYALNIGAAYRGVNVYCFEPIPKTYNQLLKNIEINSVGNIHVHNFGLSREAGVFTYFYYPEGSGNASAANLSDRVDVERVLCQVQTLDSFTKNNKVSVDFIKCDVEGAELHVFQGAIETIDRDKPIIFSEILRKWSQKFSYDPNEIFKLLRGVGYEAYTVEKNKLIIFDSMTEDTPETNFFFLHTNKHANQIKRYS